jgi:hypothetical protein
MKIDKGRMAKQEPGSNDYCRLALNQKSPLFTGHDSSQ